MLSHLIDQHNAVQLRPSPYIWLQGQTSMENKLLWICKNSILQTCTLNKSKLKFLQIWIILSISRRAWFNQNFRRIFKSFKINARQPYQFLLVYKKTCLHTSLEFSFWPWTKVKVEPITSANVKTFNLIIGLLSERISVTKLVIYLVRGEK